MSLRRNHANLLLTTVALTAAQFQVPGMALASGLPKLKVGGEIEYINVTPGANGTFTLQQGDHPISTERFLEAIERLDANPTLARQIKAEQGTRATLGMTALGLLAIAPVGLGMYFMNAQRNPRGTITMTWLGVSVVDLAAAAGVGIAYLVRSSQPLLGAGEAKEAARAYNHKLDALDGQRD